MILAREYNTIGKKPLSVGAVRTRTGFTLLAVTAYLIQLFTQVLGSYLPYLVLVTLAFLLLISSHTVIRIQKRPSYTLTWFPFLAVVFCHLIFSKFTIGYAVDLFTYCICISFMLLAGTNSLVFENIMKVAAVSAVFYAASVWFQFLVPSGYALYLRLLSAEATKKILELRSTEGALTGFSSNPGFTAGHIVSGMIALYTLKPKNQKEKSRNYFALLFLFSALLLTGKRSHLLVMLFVFLFSYLVISDNTKRIMIVNVLLIIAAVTIPALLILSEVLSAIPALGRVSGTLVGLVNGEDITNGRSGLYAFAYEQFLAHPVFGIGWGQFRENVVGSVTRKTELDTHNIYLQLLCETGIIGFLAVVIPMLLFLFHAIKNLRSTVSKKLMTDMERQLAVFALCYQLFFMVYGLSGNPLYDHNYVLMYFIACAMTAMLSRKLRRGA